MAPQTVCQTNCMDSSDSSRDRASAQVDERNVQFERTIEALHRLTRLEPANPAHFYRMAVVFEERVRQDAALEPHQRSRYLTSALEAAERALALRPDYVEALTYKMLLFRQQARFEADAERRRIMIEEADRLRRQAIDARNRQTAGGRRLP